MSANTAISERLLDDLHRRRFHADLQRITLELQRLADELEAAVQPDVSPGGGRAAETLMTQVRAVVHTVNELDVTLAMYSEPECRGC